MIPTSAAYKQAMNGPRTFLAQVTVTFRDETVEAWDNSRLMSLSFEEATSDTGTFTVGSAIIGKLSLSVLNHDDAYSELDFIDAVMQVKIGVETANGTEYMNRGIFTVDTARADSGAILITALDNLSKMDIPYQTASKLTYPATLDQIYRDACTSCGVYPATVGFLNDDFVVQNRPTEDYTCREILSAVATMAGCFVKADRNGEIMLGWYDGLKELLSKEDYDGGTFDSGEPSYETGDSLDGGVFDNGSPYYASGDSVDGGSFSDMDDYFHLYSSSSQEIDIDDIEITGVEVLITTESEGETTTNTYLFGEEGYLISISENPLIQSYDEDMLMAVANKLIGMRFRKFSMSGRSDPAYETGDSGYVSDRKGNSYISILTSISFEVNGYEGFTCDAESVLERNMTRYNETARNFTKVVQKTEQMVNEEKTARELAIEQLTNRVNNSSGLFTTIETQSDGSKIFKLHDKPTLEESQIVWTMTAEAWTVSTNGGETPNAGMTVDGDTIVRILTATGINADWINSGTIRAINIVGSTISGAEIVGGTIRTATVEGYVNNDTYNSGIQSVEDNISGLEDELENLQIGGRNLIPNTNDMGKYVISGGLTVITDDERYSVVNYPATTTLAWRSFATKNNIRYTNVRNKEVTVSFEYRSDSWTPPASGSGNNYPVLSLDISNVSETSNSRDAFWSYYSSAIGQPSTEWKKFVHTVNVTDALFTSGTGDPTESSWFYAHVFNYSLNHMQVRKFKIEIGSKATDWSPAPEDTTSYADNLAADLQDQIDGKVETYSQTSDPSSSWTTTALKTQHTGDLWYNPSTKLTRRWSGTAWVTLQSAEAEEASELAQTKAQIFISTPTVPYYQGDLWFNNTTSDIMTCIRNRTSGSYTASDWQKRNKYTDDTKANAAQQTANSALNSASSASTLANQAKSAADTANANANQASQMAEAVRQDLAVSGAVEINGGNIKSDTVNAMLVDAGVLVGLVISNGNGTFYVDAQGNLIASSADIRGKIEADEGRIGSLIINSHGFKSNTVEIQDNPGDPLIWLTMALDGSWSRSNYEADAAIVRAYDQENSPTGWSCYMMSADRSFNSSGQMQLSPNPKVMFEYMDNGIASRRFLLDTMGLSYLNSDYSDYEDAFFNIRFAGASIIFSSGDMFIQSSGGSTHVYINGTPY